MRTAFAEHLNVVDAKSLAKNMISNVELVTNDIGQIVLVTKDAASKNDFIFLYGEIKKAGESDMLWSIPLYCDKNDYKFVVDTSTLFGHAKFASTNCKPNCSWKLVASDNRIGVAIVVSSELAARTPITIPNPFQCAAFCMCNNESCSLVLPPYPTYDLDNEATDFKQWVSNSNATKYVDAIRKLQSSFTKVDSNLLDKVYHSKWYFFAYI